MFDYSWKESLEKSTFRISLHLAEKVLCLRQLAVLAIGSAMLLISGKQKLVIFHH